MSNVAKAPGADGAPVVADRPDWLAALDRGVARLAQAPFWRVRLLLVVLALAVLLPSFFTLSVTDRDEGLFIQASRQMAETGDLIDIRFQDEARHKKPVGIYWIQSAVVTAMGGPDAVAPWAYRLPSLAGAIAAVVLTHAIVATLAGGPAALGASFIMASTLVLGGEARIAKTDAVLLAVTLAAMLVLARLYARRAGGPDTPRPRVAGWEVYAFWACLGVAVLVKGPIAPMVVGLAVATLAIVQRGAGWARPLMRWPAILLGLALVLPWLVAITVQTGLDFWIEAVVVDLLSKAADGQESKGAPPGAHLLALVLTFGPGVAVLALALPAIWALRRHPAAVFALAWALPTWVVFELVPTKLPHYTLPAFPALALLAALGWQARAAGSPGRGGRIGAALLLLGGPLLVAAMLGVALAGPTPLAAWPAALGLPVALALAFVVWRAMGRDLRWATLALLLPLAAVTQASFLGSFSRHAPFWPSVGVVDVLDRAVRSGDLCAAPNLVTAGFHEPSLVVLTTRETLRAGPEGAAAALADTPCTAAIVEGRMLEAFTTAAEGQGLILQPLGRVEAIELGMGRDVVITVFTTRDTAG